MKKILLLLGVICITSASAEFNIDNCFNKLDEVTTQKNLIVNVYNEKIKENKKSEEKYKELQRKYITRQEHLLLAINSASKACRQ